MCNFPRLRLTQLLGLELILLSALSVPLQAANAAIKVAAPWDRAYVYWNSAAEKPGAPALSSAPQRFKGKSATIELPVSKNPVSLTVYDTTTGNEAIQTVKPDAKTVTLKKSDFDVVRRVQVKITADKGKPVESALVELKDAAGTVKKALVDPTTSGVAEFTDVTSGDGSVKVSYGQGKTATQEVTINDERDTPVLALEVPVGGDVVTVAERKTAGGGARAGETEERPARKSGGAWILALIGSMVGLIFLVGIVVVIFLVLRTKGVTLEDGLKKVGVDLPQGDQQAVAGAPVAQAPPAGDPNMCPFCGLRKDPATGQCACTVVPQTASSALPSVGPRLIGVQGVYSANIFPITSDVITLGREPDNTVPLPNDTTVSRHHTRIAREAGGYVVYDAGSSNGTFVNGEKISQRPIAPGDEIQVGSTKFRFEM